ncbi:replication initiation protein, partial [Lactobacillus crispatus]|nr:replication initiation protein [Lactobacillus crispatus]
RKSAGVKVEGVKSWERLELQVRGKKADEWLINSKKMLECFKMPEIEKAIKEDKNGQRIPLNLQEKAMLFLLLQNPNEWQNIGSNSTKTKYRKIIKENDCFGLNNDYADLAFDQLKIRKKDLDNEVKSFLFELKKAERKLNG